MESDNPSPPHPVDLIFMDLADFMFMYMRTSRNALMELYYIF